MIELVPAYGDRNLFMRLAKDYVETLRQYDDQIVFDEVSWMHYLWNADFIMEDRTVQGFVVTQEVPFNVFPDALYIAEFYVVPEARKRGAGLEAVKALMRFWAGDVFLYILNGNFTGKAFWLAVEHELGWRRIQRPEIREEKGCELRVFQTN